MSSKIITGALLVLSLSLFSCGTVQHKDYNPNGLPVEELSTLNIDKDINILAIDSDRKADGFSMFSDHTLRIPSGEHSINMSYSVSHVDGSYSRTMPADFKHTFLPGKTYNVIPSVDKNWVTFHFRECTPLDKKLTNQDIANIPMPEKKPEIITAREPEGKKYKIIGTIQVITYPSNHWLKESDGNEALLKAGAEYDPDAYIDVFYYYPTTFLEAGSIVVNGVAIKYVE